MAWQWWHTTDGGGIEVEIDDHYPSGYGWRPNKYNVGRNGPGGFIVYFNGKASGLIPGRLPAVAPQPPAQVAAQVHISPWSAVRAAAPMTLSNVAMQHVTRKFYIDFNGARDTVLDLEVEVTTNGAQAAITNCDANKQQFHRIWPYIGLDRFSVENDTDLLVDSTYIGTLRPYIAPAAPQRDKGTCQQCGDTGEFIRMALTCRRGHGLIGGC